MGSSLSKRVSNQLRSSPEFTTSCNTIFTDLQTLNQQQPPPKIFAYQLHDAATSLHATLLHSLSSPRLATWCPSPPSRAQSDAAFRSIRAADEALDCDQFREFAVVLFADAVVSSAERKVVKSVCVGGAGIAGVGLVARVGGGAVGSVFAVYAAGIATCVFLSLG